MRNSENYQNTVDAALPGYVNIPLDWSEDGSAMIYTSYNEKSFGRIYVYKPEKNEMMLLYDLSPNLNDKELGTMRFLSFESRDGYPLDGYLTSPPNSDAKNLPLLVVPHGGPTVRDNWGFDPLVQYLLHGDLPSCR